MTDCRKRFVLGQCGSMEEAPSQTASTGSRRTSEVFQSIQPGNVRRLVEKFRRLGEPTFNAKPYGRPSCSRKLTGTLTEGHIHGSVSHRKKELLSTRRKSERFRKSRLSDEKWVLLTPCLFSPAEPVQDFTQLVPEAPAGSSSCATDIPRSTVDSEICSDSKNCSKSSDSTDQAYPAEVALSCEQGVSEIVVQIECIRVSCADDSEPAKALSSVMGATLDRKSPENVGANNTTAFCSLDDNVAAKKSEDSAGKAFGNSSPEFPVYEDIEYKPYVRVSESSSVVKKQAYSDSDDHVTESDSKGQNDVVVRRSKETSNDVYRNSPTEPLYEEVEYKPDVRVSECLSPSVATTQFYSNSDNRLTEGNTDTQNKNEDTSSVSCRNVGDDNRNCSASGVVEEPIYEEIDINPPLKINRDQILRFEESLELTSSSSLGRKRHALNSYDPQLRDYDVIVWKDCVDFPFHNANVATVRQGPLLRNNNAATVKKSRSLPHVPNASSIPEWPVKNVASHGKLSSESDNCDQTSCTTVVPHEVVEDVDSRTDNENIYEDYDFAYHNSIGMSHCYSFVSESSCDEFALDNSVVDNSPELQCQPGACKTKRERVATRHESLTSSIYSSVSSVEYYESAQSDIDSQENKELAEPVSQLERLRRELVDTERKYIERLGLVNNEFRAALVAWNHEKDLIPAEVFRQIFLNIDVIHKLHSQFFLPELEACINNESDKRIEDVFLNMADFLKLYAEYTCSFDGAMKAIELWKSKVPEFSKFIQDIQRKPMCQCLTLEQHMLEPIQRIPRYQLLLQKYMELLPEDSPEYEKSKRALSKVAAAASHCNDFIECLEKYRKVLDVQQSLWNKIDLLTPSRELVLSGRMRVTQQLENDEEKHLFLFSDTLLVCRPFPRGITPPYKLTLQLDVDGMQVFDIPKEGTETFFITGTQGYLEVHPGSVEEKDKWVSAIQAVIAKFNALQRTRYREAASETQNFKRQQSSPGHRAPIWIKDPEANRCMQCAETFNPIRRRHHCRACGIVVCGKCSSKQTKLEFDHFSQLHRVCDKCFSGIQSLAENSDDTEVKTYARSSMMRFFSPEGSNSNNENRRTSIFFVLPPEEKSSNYTHTNEEEQISMLTSSLEAIIESNGE